MRRSLRSLGVLLFLLVPVVAAAGGTHVITTEDGTGADAFVLNRWPDLNYGAEQSVQLKNAAAVDGMYHHDRKGYLRFDLASLPGGLEPVALVLTVTGQQLGNPITGTQSFTVYGLDDSDPGEGWDESLITWINAPANNTSSPNELLPNASVVAEFTLEDGGVAGQEVVLADPRVATFVADDTDARVTFVVVRETYDPDPDGWVHSFYSREHPTAPAPELRFGTAATGVAGAPGGVRAGIHLGAARPNPVRGRTTFLVTSDRSTAAVLDVFDVRGRRVARPFEGTLAAGAHTIEWTANPGIPAGVYFVALRGAGEERVRRIAVVR